jgi:hypothetical protein
MSRAHRKIMTWLAAVCLSFAAAWVPMRDVTASPARHAASAPAAAAPCHGEQTAMHDPGGHEQTAMHGHGGHEHGQASGLNACPACCPGFFAAVSTRMAPQASAETALWRLPDAAPRLNARAADIFKPPRISS